MTRKFYEAKVVDFLYNGNQLILKARRASTLHVWYLDDEQVQKLKRRLEELEVEL